MDSEKNRLINDKRDPTSCLKKKTDPSKLLYRFQSVFIASNMK